MPRSVKYTVAVLGFSTLLLSAANGADLRTKAPPVSPRTAQNWTGCHVGASVGYGWGKDQGYDAAAGEPAFGVPPTPVAPSFNVSGALGGVHAGCDYQMAAWVFGVEGDWSATKIKGQTFEFPGAPVLGGNFVQSIKENWLSTIRGRAGYAAANWCANT